MVKLRIIILISICLSFISCRIEKKQIGEINLQKIKNVVLGMDTSKVKKLMGEPETRYKFKGELFYDYSLPPNASGQLTLVFDSLGILIFRGNIPLSH